MTIGFGLLNLNLRKTLRQFSGTGDQIAALIELDPLITHTLIPTRQKPFDLLAEGLLSRLVGATGFERRSTEQETSD